MSGTGDDLKTLNEKLEAMMRRLDYLEALLTESRQYPEIAQLMGDLKVGAALYGEPLKLIQRLLGVRRHLERTPDSRDEVSRIILNALALKGPMNISQMTREGERERGSASRVTVRKKVQSMMEDGVLEKGEGFEYRLKE
jgi:hypothetical protein